jgi:hypothetical protein
MKTEGNDLAFPNRGQHEDYERATGLTKREYFAAMAMQGFIASDLHAELSERQVSSLSIEAADNLINELNKNNE